MDMHHLNLEGISKLSNITESRTCPNCPKCPNGTDVCWGTGFIENLLRFPNIQDIKSEVSMKLFAKIASCYASQWTNDKQVLWILDFLKSPLKEQLADTLMRVEGKIKAKKPQHMWEWWSAVTYRVTGMVFETVVQLAGIFIITFNKGIKEVPWNLK